MSDIFSIVSGAGKIHVRNDDDFVDRLSHRYTTAVLLIFSVVVVSKQYVGDPINCWVPAHFTSNHEEYANNICWISNTYYLPFEEDIPKPHEPRKHIPYYQWVPIILLFQALLFYLPCLLWRSLNSTSGIDVTNIVEAAGTFQHMEFSETREKTLTYMTKQFDRYLGSRKKKSRKGLVARGKELAARTCCFIWGRRYGNFLVVLYLVTKSLYIINVILQLFMLNEFLGTDYHLYGLDIMRHMASGKDWMPSPRFPRVTLCDFETRRLGNVHRYTVQCVLPVNLFNEKIFLFIWFWMVMVAAVTCVNFLAWVSRCLFRMDQIRYVKKHLKLMSKYSSEDNDKKTVLRFVEKYLKHDGVFVIRLVGHNATGLVATELTGALWDNFLRNRAYIDQTDKDASNVWGVNRVECGLKSSTSRSLNFIQNFHQLTADIYWLYKIVVN